MEGDTNMKRDNDTDELKKKANVKSKPSEDLNTLVTVPMHRRKQDWEK